MSEPTVFPMPTGDEPLDLSLSDADYAEAGVQPPLRTGRPVPNSPMAALLENQEKAHRGEGGETKPWGATTQPGFGLVYSLGVDPDEVQRLARSTVPPNKRKRFAAEDINEVVWLAKVLGRYNSKILYNGEVWTDRSGDPITFRHDEILQVFPQREVYERVLAFFTEQGKGQLLVHGRGLLRESGIGSDEPEEIEEDPTSRER